MYLHIQGEPRHLEDIRAFREAHHLPDTFGVAHFEPKDFTGLARIDDAGPALKRVRENVLTAVPDQLSVQQLMLFEDLLTKVFHNALIAVNDQVNLKTIEIDFAVNGFRAVISAVIIASIRASLTHSSPPTFTECYGQWLNDGVRVSAQQHTYTHQAVNWSVQVINTAYGRAGLIVQTADSTHYLADAALGCPAEGFMFNLLKSTSERIIMGATR